MKRWVLFFVMYVGMTLFLLWAVASRAEICPYPVLERRLDRLENHVFRYPLGRNDHGKESQ